MKCCLILTCAMVRKSTFSNLEHLCWMCTAQSMQVYFTFLMEVLVHPHQLCLFCFRTTPQETGKTTKPWQFQFTSSKDCHEIKNMTHDKVPLYAHWFAIEMYKNFKKVSTTKTLISSTCRCWRLVERCPSGLQWKVIPSLELKVVIQIQ